MNDDNLSNNDRSLKSDSVGERVIRYKYESDLSIRGDFFRKLLDKITATQTYIKYSEYLPSAAIIAKLYISENMVFKDYIVIPPVIDSITFRIRDIDCEFYIKSLYEKSNIEKALLKALIRIIKKDPTRIIDLTGQPDLDLLNKISERAKRMQKYYWNWIDAGEGKELILFASTISSALLFKAMDDINTHKTSIKSLAKQIDSLKSICEPEPIEVDTVKDITMIIDISFKQGSRKVKIILTNKKKERISCDGHLSIKQVNFLLNILGVYLKSNLNEESNGYEEDTIEPGQILLIDTEKKHKVCLTKNDKDTLNKSYGGSPVTFTNSSTKTNSKNDHKYIIGSMIRKLVVIKAGKTVIFSKKNNSLITNIRIIVCRDQERCRFKQRSG